MDIIHCIGNTPHLYLDRWAKYHGLRGRLVAKWEGANLTGSIKDRLALWLIQRGIQEGALPPGGHIIEATSGNTGISLGCIGGLLGYRVTVVMPEGMSEERTKLLTLYGAHICFSKKEEGMRGAERLANQLRGYHPRQFENPQNPYIHYMTTGKELSKVEGISCFACGVGTGGTFMGIGKRLKKKNPGLHLVGVEPEESPVLSLGRAGPHGIEGIGAGFVPPLWDGNLADAILRVTTQEAEETAKGLLQKEGILVGISGGCNVAAITRLAKERGEGLYATVLPDRGERYFSKNIFCKG